MTRWKSFHLKFDHVHFTSKDEFFIVSFRIALKHAQSAEGLNDETLDVPALLRDIINTQNKQIQDMQGWLERWWHCKNMCQMQKYLFSGMVGKIPNTAHLQKVCQAVEL